MSHCVRGAVLCMFLAGCVVVPPDGPSVVVMPAPGKPFDVFQSDNYACKGFAQQQAGFNANQAQQQAVGSAAAGAILGAAAGAALGGNSHAAASGATGGLLVGSAVGATSNAQMSSYEMQRRYDVAYEQCMYAKGNQVQGYQLPGYQAPGYGAPYYPPPPPPPHG